MRPALARPIGLLATTTVFGVLPFIAAIGCGVSKPAVPLGGAGGSPGATSACLDRPTDLPRPPTGTLPCELLPPDFSR
ncbi:MAG TPA: hypothetical protein VIU64_12075 [Polyangia bacterium]